MPKNFVHQGFKGGQCVGQPKRCDKEFVMPFVSPKSCFSHITALYSYLVINGFQV